MKFIVHMIIMRNLNLSSVDLSLLPALDALLRRRHVTRAAEDVGLSQPAMSHVLARLRRALGDDLLVRGPSGLALTSRAEEIAPHVAAILEAAKVICRPPKFEPSKVRRTLRLVGCDWHSILFAPDLVKRIREQAPGIELSIESYTRDVFKRVAEGAVDLAFFNTQTPLPSGAVSTVVGEDRYALVMREGHPAAKKKWTLADYAKWDSVVVSFTGDGMSDIDARLAKAGIARRVGLSTPHFMGCLAAVSATDMIATTSHLFAARHAKVYRLVIRKPPFSEGRFINTLIGSASRMNDPVIRWFCALFKDVYENLQHRVLHGRELL
ncbi:MAG: LysR substrate-binding domain-containing protein [Alphaproteobacteria bacterium]|nr:LysR substrate-binding domain-containing protein [Alphaproteobacteria bacterium]